MRINKLRLHHFRNFMEQEVTFCSGVNILVGNNGQGKTNLLEALYLACKGRSFRYGPHDTLIEKNSSGAFVEAQIEHRDLEYPVLVNILKSRKHHTVLGKKWTASDLNRHFQCILFSPESLSAIKESAEHRRDLVDDFVVSYDPAASELIADYRKTLRTRNKILANYVEKLEDKSTTERLLESINERFLHLAVSLTMKRLLALREIEPDFNHAMKLISAEAFEPVEITYSFTNENRLRNSHSEIEDCLAKRMEELRQAEMSVGASLIGPHKHDIAFLYGGQDSRYYCSQGQQRALIISFKIAQIVYHRRANGFYPILMLDDVLSELDQEKQEALIRFLGSLKAQIFVTTTDVELSQNFQNGEISVLHVERGHCEPFARMHRQLHFADDFANRFATTANEGKAKHQGCAEELS